MQPRIKYPLTPEAKEAAKQLVEAWDTHKIDQHLVVREEIYRGDDVIALAQLFGFLEYKPNLAVGVIRELGKYGLVDVLIRIDKSTRYEVTLLQELRNAVQNDFDVSDFFLTTSAIGTIIYGNLTLDKNAIFQSAAAGIGDVNISAELLPDELVKVLGAEFLQANPDVSQAINELRDADEPTHLQKMGNIISSLGRSLEHIGNASAAIEAIIILGKATGVI